MLTKIENPRRAYISRVAVLPVIALVLFAFSFRTKEINAANASPEKQDFRAMAPLAVDTPPVGSKKEIVSVDVRTKKELTITYTDGTSETLTEDEANKRGLINSGGYGNDVSAKNRIKIDSSIRMGPGMSSNLLWIVDGKETSKEEGDKIDPNTISSINVLKGSSAISKYGEKGKNGVIEMKLKKAGVEVKEVIMPNQPQENINFNNGTQTGPVFTESEEPAAIDQMVWRDFLEKNHRTIIEAVSSKDIQGTFITTLRFIVNTDGSLSDIEIVKDPGHGIGQKIAEIVKSSPKWKPARQNGRAVRSYVLKDVTLGISDADEEEINTQTLKPNTTPEKVKSMTLHQLAGLSKTEEILSLTLTTDDDNKDLVVAGIKGNSLNKYGRKLLESLRKGKILTVDDIRVKRSGIETKIPSKVYIM